MSYTPPLGNAADFSFAASTSYTAPAGNAADFIYVLVAAGSANTTFGTPVGRMNRIETATGAATPVFGLAHVIPGFVGGLLQTKFGIPTTNLYVGAYTPTTAFGVGNRQFGIYATRFGTGRVFPYYALSVPQQATFGTGFTNGGHWQHVSSAPSTRIPRAYTAFNQTAVATGFLSGGYGTPLMYVTITVPLNVTGWVESMAATRFGTPVSVSTQSGAATGISATHVGTPFGVRGGTTTGTRTTALGTPASTMSARSVGTRTTLFGSPTLTCRVHAQSVYRATRWGTSTCVRSNTYTAYGINASNRFGQPTGYQRLNRGATGFSSTQFGANVTSLNGHYARHIAPTAQTGTHRLVRTSC
jgi:hypothetical protein